MAGRAYVPISLIGVRDPATATALRLIDTYLRDQRPATTPAGSGGGLPDETYVVMSASAPLTNERVLAVSSPITKSDGGAGGNVTIGLSIAALAGTPALTLGTVNAGGAATTFIRTDATIALFDATLPADLNAAAATGVAAFAARRDHVHEVKAFRETGGVLVSIGAFAAGAVISSGASVLTEAQLAIARGGTAGNTATSAFNNLSPTTTKGDLIVQGAVNDSRLGVGADGTVLTADSVAALGVSWQAPGASFIDTSFQVFDNLDNTKVVMLQCTGITTGTTRTLTVPDGNGTIVLLAGQLGGTGASPDVRGLRETSGPTLLTMGAVADGEFLKRSGATIVGGAAGGGSSEFADNVFRVIGSADATKKIAFEVDGNTTGTTRTYTVPDFNGIMAMFSTGGNDVILDPDTGNGAFAVSNTTGANVNVLQARAVASGSGPVLEPFVHGTGDTDVDLAISPLGTGKVLVSTGSIPQSECATRGMLGVLAALHFAGAMA